MIHKKEEVFLLEKFLEGLAAEVEANLSTNVAISLYDIIGEFYLDEDRFELKLAAFFARMPEKLLLLHRVLGDISVIRSELRNGGQKTELRKQKMEAFFEGRSIELNKRWQKNNR